MKIDTIDKNIIAVQLRDFSKFMFEAIVRHNDSFIDVYKNYYSKNYTEGYGIDKYYVANYFMQLFLVVKLFSMLYDNYFNFLREDKIEEVLIPDDIFVNPNDRNRFSKKQIIKYIRNALNHNDLANTAEIISFRENNVTVPKIEITLNNTPPIPFHVIIGREQLFKMGTSLMDANTVVASYMIRDTNVPIINDQEHLYSILNNTVYRKYYTKGNLKDGSLDKLNNLVKKNYNFAIDKDNIIDNILEHYDSSLSISQKRKIISDFQDWKQFTKNDSADDILLNCCFHHAIPLSCTKFNDFLACLGFLDYVAMNPNSSISGYTQECKDYINGRNTSFDFESVRNQFSTKTKFFIYAWNVNELYSLLSSIYIGHMFDTIITDPVIDINGKQYERRHLRNAFVHLRWFMSEQYNYRLFDWGNAKGAELNPNHPSFWKGIVKTSDVITYVNNCLNQILLANNQAIISVPPSSSIKM